MPSSHRRIGLVVDEPVVDALGVLRKRAGDAPAEAALARRAMFDAAAFEAIQDAAGRGGATGREASALVKAMRDLLPTLELPDSVLTALMRELDDAIEAASRELRRERQLGLLRSPDRYGETVLALTEELDELESVPD